MREVLLNRDLDKETISQAKETLESAVIGGDKEIILVINSDGGSIRLSMELLEMLRQAEKNGLVISVQIYKAASMATVIALSVGTNKIISRSGSISFHKATLKLPASDYDLETGLINHSVMVQVRKYNVLLQNILTRYGLSSDKKVMALLHGSGCFSLPAGRCVVLGMGDYMS